MSFNFKNWASLIVFTYMTLVLIFGFQIAQTLDQRDISKLNDMDGDGATFTGIDQMEKQFPVQAYALQRQVNLMSFASEEITSFKFFIILTSQFHPVFTMKYRFDPCITRSDRFLFSYMQLTLLCILSFLIFRETDMPNPDTGRLEFKVSMLYFPALLTIGFSLLLLSPLPSFFTSLMQT